MLAIIDRPAYWAFCWASGQVTARFLLDNPSICKNKTVIDFGSGSGVLSVAAALTGAASVIACDSDADARAAILENAKLNQVKSIEVISDLKKLTSKPRCFCCIGCFIRSRELRNFRNLGRALRPSPHSGLTGPRPLGLLMNLGFCARRDQKLFQTLTNRKNFL